MGEFKLPPDHQPAMEVPRGGSCCANCKFLGEDGKSCRSPHYQEWAGTERLPKPAGRYCSDWWQSGEGEQPRDTNEAFSRMLGRKRG